MLTNQRILQFIKPVSRYISVHVVQHYKLQERYLIVKMSNQFPKCRDDPVIMKLDTPQFQSIFTPELIVLRDLFKKYNYELRVAGGAVRDILMGKTPKDLDFATTATPQEMKDMFTNENVRMINVNGEKHGTVTSRINDKENFEITTLRVDVATDGRHAQVQFTKDWKVDANRRDLTINSMYLDLDGRVYDYFYGYDDLQKKRIVFVGDAKTRIREDYLRIMRYFRFYGRIAENPNNHDKDTIAAIKETVEGLERISGERIWAEWTMILSGNFYKELILKMIDCGLAKYVGLPENPDVDNFRMICERCLSLNITLRPITLLTSLLKDQDELMNLHSRLKFSAFDRELALFLIKRRNDILAPKPLKPYYLLILNAKGKLKDMRDYVAELFKYRGQLDLLRKFEEWDPPNFPVSGSLLRSNVSHPKLIGILLTSLKEIWVDSDFKMTREELMERVPKIISNIEDRRIK